ncbi:MAG: hypothetical protein LBQ57_09305 [Spirochaetales bacterium]|jgi:hypothetical protein|nr:hypothetical protein [Spirochaetales bacterium]
MDYKHSLDSPTSPRPLRPPRLKIFSADFFFIGICVIGALTALAFFWRDLNLSLTRLTEQPVGTVSYKYRAIQRRFADRLFWERLKQESPVYDGDFVRTAELSQALVSFFSGDERISLEENTLIQIRAESGDLRIDLKEGELSANAGSRSLSVSAGEAVVAASPGSTVTVTLDDPASEGLEVQALEGSAEIRRGNRTLSLGAGDVYRTGGAGTARVAALSPRPSAKFLNAGESPLPVVFGWNKIGFTGNERVRLEIAEDRFFTRTLRAEESAGDGVRAELENGIYYWRAYPASEEAAELKRGSVSGRLAVIYAPVPVLLSPADEEVFSFMTARPGIRFTWSACEGAAAYLVEAAENPDMRNPVFSSQVQAAGGDTGSTVYSGLRPGAYYWRVLPVYSRNYEGAARVSAAGSFRIEKAETLTVPQAQGWQREVYLESGQGNSYFTWTPEEEAAYYTFLLSKQEDLRNPLIEQRVRDNYYAFDVKAAGLATGEYYWGVYQTDTEGNRSRVSEARTLVVVAGTPPPQPLNPVIAPAKEEPPAAALPEQPEGPPPLPSPRNLRPASGYALTEEIIIRDQKMDFAWEAVPGAASYSFVLYHVTPQGNKETFRRTMPETTFTLSDLTVLDAGRFLWRVTAENSGTGRRSAAAESRFTVEITEVEGTRGEDMGVIFGK